MLLSHNLCLVQIVLEVIDHLFKLFRLEIDLWDLGDLGVIDLSFLR